MGLLEAEIHDLLKDYQRQQSYPAWPHSLTLGRLVARAIRCRRSALLQTSCLPSTYGISYLLPCLLSREPIQLVASPQRQQQITQRILPALIHWLTETGLEPLVSDGISAEPTAHLTVLTLPQWLQAVSHHPLSERSPVLTVIEQAEDLEASARDYLTQTLTWPDLQSLPTLSPQHKRALLNHWSCLSRSLFSRPPNLFDCYPLDDNDQQELMAIFQSLKASPLTPPVKDFWTFWQTNADNYLLWATMDRRVGRLKLHLAPVRLYSFLQPYWSEVTRNQLDRPGEEVSALIILGGFLDADKAATTFRRTLGLGEMLCLKFMPHRAQSSLPIYLPETFPLPNSPAFKPCLFSMIETLIHSCFTSFSAHRSALTNQPFIVVLLDDSPLKKQLGSAMAARFGSGVKVEPNALCREKTEIVISSWHYWCQHNRQFRSPTLLILATLPIPSLENPLVASRVQFHKRHRQDWFRDYLLPTALRALQQAVLPLREAQGKLAILDNRVNSRSYGWEILNILSPYARCNYIDY